MQYLCICYLMARDKSGTRIFSPNPDAVRTWS